MIFPLPLLFVIGRSDLWDPRLIDGEACADGQSAQKLGQKPYPLLSENTACPAYFEQNVFSAV
jgi:hypothetical protein